MPFPTYNNRPIMTQILEKIKAYHKIIVMRHFRPDGDAIGSTKGLVSILKATYPDKEIYLQNDDFAAYLAFMGEEDAPLPDEAYADALGIVIDTGTVNRMSNKRFSLCREVIKIDHHIDDKPYGDISWVEEERSSACEMIVAFYEAFQDELVMTKEAATYLYTGMVTDSGRFRFAVSPETLRLAALLLSEEIDTETLFAQLYMKDFHILLTNGELMRRIQRTPNGVAWLYISKADREALGLTVEEAANCVGLMESIKGSLIWLAFIEYDDGSIRGRLRSRFVAVQPLGVAHHGGGHANASGAICDSEEEVRQLIDEADALLGEYKATHEGWL